MKIILALGFLIICAGSFASEDQKVLTTVDSEKTIKVLITNESEKEVDCKYSVSWFVNTFSFKKQFGHVEILAEGNVELSFKNDEFSYLTRIKTKVSCD
jgi:uncharacterized protein YcfL